LFPDYTYFHLPLLQLYEFDLDFEKVCFDFARERVKKALNDFFSNLKNRKENNFEYFILTRMVSKMFKEKFQLDVSTVISEKTFWKTYTQVEDFCKSVSESSTVKRWGLEINEYGDLETTINVYRHDAEIHIDDKDSKTAILRETLKLLFPNLDFSFLRT